MALTLNPSVSITLDFVDETQSRSKLRVHLPSSTTAANAKTRGDALAALAAAITGCGVPGYTISYNVEEPAGVVPGAGSRVEHKGRFLFTRANGLSTRLEVPAILSALVRSDGAIDPAQADVAAFLAEITGGGYTGNDGSDIVSVNAAYEAFKSSTPTQLPSTRLILP